MSPDDRSIEFETVAMAIAEQTYLQLYERLSSERWLDEARMRGPALGTGIDLATGAGKV
jgi:hypothetical protein